MAGVGFILPAVILILLLSVLFLAEHPPLWVAGAGAGAGAAVAAVAVQAARGLIGPSLARVRGSSALTARWVGYLAVGGAAAVAPRRVSCTCAAGVRGRRDAHAAPPRPCRLGRTAAAGGISAGGIGALAWTAFKVGALSFGGGFVIIPLMQSDAVHTYHWMTNPEFLSAVALGQITPGPVVATVAAVGYAAHGLAGGLLAALVAFTPSFSFILLGGSRFEQLRNNRRARAFLDGAGPAAIGAILGAAILLAGVLQEAWQLAILAAALIALLILKRGIVETLLAAGTLGVVAALAGAPLPH